MATSYGQSIVVHQGTTQNIPLYNLTGSGAVTVTICKPGTSTFGAVNDTSPTVWLDDSLYYIWNADEVDLDTLGCNVVKVVAGSDTSYTYVNVIEAQPVVPEIAPRPAL